MNESSRSFGIELWRPTILLRRSPMLWNSAILLADTWCVDLLRWLAVIMLSKSSKMSSKSWPRSASTSPSLTRPAPSYTTPKSSFVKRTCFYDFLAQRDSRYLRSDDLMLWSMRLRPG